MVIKTLTLLQKRAKEEREKHMGIGFTIRKVGIGDGVQFTSLPENFFRKTGHKLIDVSKPWYLDNNPYVIRDAVPKRTVELWNYPTQYEWPKIRDSVYMNNAEIHSSVFDLRDPVLTHPRLYKFEDYPFWKREKILFHPHGRSHGSLPDYVIKSVVKKYNGPNFYQIGDFPNDPIIPEVQTINTPDLWSLAQVLSEARMLIGIDSGPSWIAACYPDVIIKKIRTKFQYGYCEPKDWVALDIKNSHSFWDDLTLFQIFNCFEDDVGFTKSYRRI